MSNTTLLHLMIRHGVDALADAFLDQCVHGVTQCARAMHAVSSHAVDALAIRRVHHHPVPHGR